MNKFAIVLVLGCVAAYAASHVQVPPSLSLAVADVVRPAAAPPLSEQPNEVPAGPVDPVLVAQRGKAFIYVGLLRHEAECPTARTATFKAARKAMLLDAARDAVDVPAEVIAWTHADQFDKYRATPGPWCRLITGLITDRETYQRLLTRE